jgi:outer membrane immunogenic protein
MIAVEELNSGKLEMKKLILAAAGLLALSVTSAGAADLGPRMVTKAPPMATTVYNWTGCYIGGHAGGAWSNSNMTVNNGATLVENFGYTPSSFLGGGQVGCQYQFAPNWVIGAEGTWSGMSLNQTDVGVLSPTRTRAFKLDQIATATAKLGYTWGPWMLYAKGGFADARIDTFMINNATGVFGDVRQWQAGWTVGGGLDYMVTPNFILGAEFNYYRFGFDRTVPASDGTIGTVTNSRADAYSAVARASWLFNLGGPVVARY